MDARGASALGGSGRTRRAPHAPPCPRAPPQAFFKRFRCIGEDPALRKPIPPGCDWIKSCHALIAEIVRNDPKLEGVFKFGKTMMLYKADQSRRLDALRQKAQEDAAKEIERVYRAHRVRKIARMMRAQREAMRAAIRARDLAAIKAANADSKKLKFRLAEMRVLDPLETLLTKEAKLAAELEALLPLEPADHTARYEKALKRLKGAH